METIVFLELNSIAQGIEVSDIMLKTSEVKLLDAKPCCPGKYVILICGDVAAVKSSVEAGKQVGGSFVIESTVIPRVHPQVISAISMSTEIINTDALGILEFFSITSAIMAADAAAKAADVQLIEVRLGIGIGGKSFITMTGDVAAVSESVKCGANIGGENGLLLNQIVIPNPRKEIFTNMF